MPVIEVSFPLSQLRDLRMLAEFEDIDVDSFILWAVAEKIGELKGEIFRRAIQDNVGTVEPLIQHYPTIKNVIAHENFILHLEFESGLEGTFDMSPLFRGNLVFNVVADPEIFKTLKVVENGKFLHWVNPKTGEEINIMADILYDFIWRSGKEKFEE